MQPNQQNSWKILILACTMFVICFGSTAYTQNQPQPLKATPTRTPIQSQVIFEDFNADSLGVQGTFNVPAKQRLVIENISATIIIPPDEVGFIEFSTIVNGATVFHEVLIPQVGIKTFSGQLFNVYNGGQQMRIYADPGTTINFIVNRNEATCPPNVFCGQALVTFSGYLLPANSPDLGP